eukprot:3562053-Rhodomonas_salina.2
MPQTSHKHRGRSIASNPRTREPSDPQTLKAPRQIRGPEAYRAEDGGENDAESERAEHPPHAKPPRAPVVPVEERAEPARSRCGWR